MKQKQIKSAYVVKPIFKTQRKQNPVILRAILSTEYTRIDFGYSAPWMYDKGGWIHIAPYTFLEVQSTNERFKLTGAINIPIAPERHDFESTEDWRVFSLYFEPIPVVDCSINIFEEENPNDDDFNYYEIKFENVKEVEMILDFK
jgi:hypothetical protein